MHRLLLLMSLFLLFSIGTSRSALSFTIPSSRALIKFEATVRTPFAVALPESTHVNGEYSLITGPKWLSLSNQGILFGTPTEHELGDHELYVSATRLNNEYLFHLVVTVSKSVVLTPKFKWEAQVGQIFKQDFAKLMGEEGTYSYENLPEWMKGLSSGIIIGEPSDTDLGDHYFQVHFQKGKKQSDFKVKITVVSEQPDFLPFRFRVDEHFQIDLETFLGVKGRMLLNAPSLPPIRIVSNRLLTGTGRAQDVGLHRIEVVVEGIQATSQFAFYISIEE